MTVIATAGHVDHGKSTLVLALTGTDPDRWAEEKARGLTIDLGFAATTLPSAAEVSFVDVPGHVRFLPNMLAGAGAVEACLFVVAATEGWKPQSEEHLRILELLGVERGVVALTKVGLVDDDDRLLARMIVEDHLAGSALAGAEIIEVDALAGIGVDDLRLALDRLVAAAPAAADRGRPRLWVDRAFAARGSGTVVTGTLAGGALHAGETVELRPSGATSRVRAIQTHGRGVEEIGPGHRVALNLAGVSHVDVGRGHAVVRPGQWVATRRFDASLHVLDALDHPVGRRGAYTVHVGAGEHPARLRILGPEALTPGSTGAVRLHVATPLPLVPGDRYVLREWGRGETVGGGEVLDVDPVRPASVARPDRSVDRVVRERGWVAADLLERLTGAPVTATLGPYVVDPAALAATTDAARAKVEAAGPLGLDPAALTDRERLALGRVEGAEIADGRVRLAAGGNDDPLADHAWLAALRAQPFTPPGPEGVDRAEVRELVRRGLVVERDGFWFAADAVAAAAQAVAGLLAASPEGVTVAQVRDALGSSRRHVVPLLSQLDATGVTRRRGDLRVAGPRLPAAAEGSAQPDTTVSAP